MSVLLRNRKLSGVQYIDTARELVRLTLTNCKKFPKSMTILVTKHITKLAINAQTKVIKANSIYPKTQQDIGMRYAYLVDARGDLEALDGILSTIIGLWELKLSDYAWIRWGELITKEKNLITAVINSDKKNRL